MYMRSAKSKLTISHVNTFRRSGEISNLSYLLLVGFLFMWKATLALPRELNSGTMSLLVLWSRALHRCLIWQPRHFGLALREPLPPVPPIVPEFSIFGRASQSGACCHLSDFDTVFVSGLFKSHYLATTKSTRGSK